MKVRFYGVRGSVPTPGPRTVRYGGNTVCVDVRLSDGTVLILDSGTGIRELGTELLKHELHRSPLNVLLTHLHWDHILGLPFFAPVYRKESVIRIHPLGTDHQRIALRDRIFDGVHFPIRAADLPAQFDFIENVEQDHRIGSAVIRRIALNHPGGAQGYRIDDDDGKSLCYLTDNELSPPGPVTTSLDALARFSEEADLVIHDAQYLSDDMPTKHGWGHSTIDDVLQLGSKASAKHLVLFHHDPERDDDALDDIGHRANEWLRERGSSTRASVAREGWSVEL